MDEHIRLVQQSAYHEGYMAGYQRGIEDSRTGVQTPPALLDCPLRFLNLSTRPFNSLDRAGFRTIGDIVSLDRQEIWKIRSLGTKGLHEDRSGVVGCWYPGFQVERVAAFRWTVRKDSQYMISPKRNGVSHLRYAIINSIRPGR